MVKKSFFKERDVLEIKSLQPRRAYSPRGLVERIDGLADDEAVEIRNRIIPGKFYRGNIDGREAGIKAHKHGNLVMLSNPKTQHEAYSCNDIPLAIRARDLGKLEEMREEDINYVGYGWYPVQGRDRRKRKVPFVWLFEGQRIFAYAENMAGGIDVMPSGSTREDEENHAKRIAEEGETIVCRVPSRRQKEPRYNLKLHHVPIDGVTERRAVVWSLNSEYEQGRAPAHITLGNIRYTYKDEREGSDIFTFYPQDIAAYIATIKHFNEKHNLTPAEMSPLALISKRGVNFYKRLCNNTLVFDPTITGRKDHLRKPNLAEKSILLARATGVLGHDEIMFWDPSRDGKLKDYFSGKK